MWRGFDVNQKIREAFHEYMQKTPNLRQFHRLSPLCKRFFGNFKQDQDVGPSLLITYPEPHPIAGRCY
jgi:hypothetical protein